MDYTQLAADEIIDRAFSARDEFNALYESNDTSDGTLDRMASLVDELESLQTEADARVAFAILNEKREELARKVGKKLLLPGGLNQRTPSVLPARPVGSGPIAVGFAEDDADAKKSDFAEVKAALQAKVEELAGKIPPAFLKNIEKVKAKAAAAKGEKDSKVEAQLDAPYKDDLSPSRAAEIKVTDAVTPSTKETDDVEKKAVSKPTLAVNKDVEPIEHMPTEGFPIGDKKHPGASTIKSGSVKGVKIPKPASPVVKSEQFLVFKNLCTEKQPKKEVTQMADVTKIKQGDQVDANGNAVKYDEGKKGAGTVLADGQKSDKK